MSDFTQPPDTRFFFKLTDKKGILQHSRFSEPELVTGYSLDDNARALIVAGWHYSLYGKPRFRKLIEKFLDFLSNQRGENGEFRNYLFISHEERFLSHELAEDAFGEMIWALGFILFLGLGGKINKKATLLFEESLKKVKKFTGLRTKAYCLIGLYYRLQRENNSKVKKLALELTDDLEKAFRENKEKDWPWFEDKLTYANAILPWSLFLAFDIFKKRAILKIARQTFSFLVQKTKVNGLPAPIGQHGWYRKDGERAFFDQQPIETGYMVLASLAGFKITKEKKYLKLAFWWFDWFFGNNLGRLSLIDKSDGGCYDGLEPWKVNFNKGAESILCYLLAYLALADEKNSIGT